MSQARVSATRAGSCGTEEPTFPKDRPRQRRPEMSSRLEVGMNTHQHVGGDPRATEYAIGEVTIATLRRRVVGRDHNQVVVAIGPGLTAGYRAEQIDPRYSDPGNPESSIDLILFSGQNPLQLSEVFSGRGIVGL